MSAFTTTEQIPELLEKELNSVWAVRPHPTYSESWYIQNPFHYDDGDGVNVSIKCDDNGWLLTDHGFTIFHFFVDEFEGFGFRGTERITPVIVGSGLEIQHPGLALIMRVASDESLSASHVARFIMALERVRGASLVHSRGYHNSCSCCAKRYSDSPSIDQEDGEAPKSGAIKSHVPQL